MADTNAVDDAVVKVADNLAKALWTLVRNGAKMQENFASKLILVADGALKAIETPPKAPRKPRRAKRASAKQR
jgi:hypothetical protein